jgi:protein-L-isoaspartate(D-aspartate) O-methyltransferase
VSQARSADSAGRVEKFIHVLTAAGALSADEWREALRAVPRHLFLPSRALAVPDVRGGRAYPIDREARGDEWWAAVYSDTSVITQIDDGAGDPATGEGSRYTSSSSAPGIVCQFLELLAPLDGHRVLEIGTGTGWTAGLLSHRLGAENVTTIEVDRALAEIAEKNLVAAGVAPRVIVGDGALGYPAGAPYDRVHAACAVSSVPYPWVQQCRPGGRIVLPYTPGFGHGHKVLLEVVGDGTAVGRFVGAAGYMMMRAHRHPIGALSSFLHDEADAVRTTTRMDPRTVAQGGPGADLAVATLVPGVRRFFGKEDGGSGEETLWLLETRPDARTNGSWAVAGYAPDRDEYEVEQFGPRRLWDEVVDAYIRWLGWGMPERDRFGLTVSADGQRVWLDSPEHVLSPDAR